MSFASKYNKGSRFNYRFSKKEEYITLREAVTKYGIDTTYTIHSMYLNSKGMYGTHPVIVASANGMKVDIKCFDIPKHMTKTISDMISDIDVINSVNDGLAGFRIVSYLDRNNIERYSIEFIDFEE